MPWSKLRSKTANQRFCNLIAGRRSLLLFIITYNTSYHVSGTKSNGRAEKRYARQG